MHEMSLADSILDIVRQELQKHGMQRLLLVRVRYGTMTNIVPESLQFCFETLLHDSPWPAARLELVEVPCVLRCFACKKEFTPEGRHDLLAPCPYCGEVLGHEVLQGKELYVEHIEAE